ncbi:hypothetical protein SAMN05421770_10277 [Granulicella rosea]|uniref:Uncharacterized protein n=1 Tax=Granulicella rosea TaxID=474952 RepID=A0A239GU54_9BACT|nr:hypothetical protein [Granulicella rosea]SNS72501.1 hypothetical protein SAMN05421770_10277 [Granulicella rosea]
MNLKRRLARLVSDATRTAILCGAVMLPVQVALAQAPATSGSVTPAAKLLDPVDNLARLQALREAARRDQLLRNAQPMPLSQVVPGPELQERTVAAEENETSQPAKPGQEGIRVHGHWIVDVKNPDGALVQHHDFQNALLSTGSQMLAGLLGSEFVPANWAILLNGTTSICGSANLCGIVQSLTTQPGAALCNPGTAVCDTGLTQTVTNVGSMVLAGNFVATQAGSITTVIGYLGFCLTTPGAAYSPQSCTTGAPSSSAGNVFSSATIPAITVAAGQTVEVTVTYTFS